MLSGLCSGSLRCVFVSNCLSQAAIAFTFCASWNRTAFDSFFSHTVNINVPLCGGGTIPPSLFLKSLWNCCQNLQPLLFKDLFLFLLCHGGLALTNL